jgi:thiol-disulfide isomerase/thioredoxin
VTLESLLERGRPIALVFVGPTCGSCWVIMPHIARWQQSLAERIDIVMVSTGKPEQNEEAIEEHQIVGTFLHDGLKTLEAYRLDGTPGAVLVSTDGRIASTTVMGGRTIEPFIRMAVHDAEPNGDVPPSLAATSAAA